MVGLQDNGVKLDYARRPPRRPAVSVIIVLYTRAVGLAPHALIALFISGLVLAVRYYEIGTAFPDWLDTLLFYFPMCLPGSIKRGRLRDVGAGLALSGMLACWHMLSLAWMGESSIENRPYRSLALAAVPMLVVAASEGVARGQLRGRLPWLGAAALAAACVVCAMGQFTWGTGSTVRYGNHPIQTAPLASFLYPVWASAALWILIPMAHVAFERRAKTVKRMCLATVLTLYVAYGVFSAYIVQMVAKRSLLGQGRFLVSRSATFLGSRGLRSDWEALWKAFERAVDEEPDSEAPDIHEPRPAEACLFWLMRLDPLETRQRVEDLLRQRPSVGLADLGAPVLDEMQRRTTAPLLMRYAILGSWRCVEALEEIGEPRVAIAILANALDINDHYRRRLRTLLGQDAGTDRQRWARVYDEAFDKMQSPLAPDILGETVRIIDCFSEYWTVRGRYVGRISTLPPTVGVTFPHILRGGALSTTAKTLEVKEPDWDVRTTAELETEVQLYAEEVNRLIRKNLQREGVGTTDGAAP